MSRQNKQVGESTTNESFADLVAAGAHDLSSMTFWSKYKEKLVKQKGADGVQKEITPTPAPSPTKHGNF